MLARHNAEALSRLRRTIGSSNNRPVGASAPPTGSAAARRRRTGRGLSEAAADAVPSSGKTSQVRSQRGDTRARHGPERVNPGPIGPHGLGFARAARQDDPACRTHRRAASSSSRVLPMPASPVISRSSKGCPFSRPRPPVQFGALDGASNELDGRCRIARGMTRRRTRARAPPRGRSRARSSADGFEPI